MGNPLFENQFAVTKPEVDNLNIVIIPKLYK